MMLTRWIGTKNKKSRRARGEINFEKPANTRHAKLAWCARQAPPFFRARWGQLPSCHHILSNPVEVSATRVTRSVQIE